MSQKLFTERLAPLLNMMRMHGYRSAVAWSSGRVVVEHDAQIATLTGFWDSAQHDALTSDALLLQYAGLVVGDILARVVDGVIVLRRLPDPRVTLQSLVEQGTLSSLAEHTLVAALQSGRNVVIVGSWRRSMALFGALLHTADRSVLLGADDHDEQWMATCATGRDAVWLGAERVGVIGDVSAELADALVHCHAVIGWCHDQRPEHALAQLCARAHSGGHMHDRVLPSWGAAWPGVDLVVVMTPNGMAPDAQGHADVQAIVECVADAHVPWGARCVPLLTTGHAPIPRALVPVGMPTFLDDLVRLGHGVLADEWRHSQGDVHVHVPGHAAPRTATAPAVPVNTRNAAPTRETTPVVTPTPSPMPRAIVPAFQLDADAQPPGWELDQLGDAWLPEANRYSMSSDETALEIAYGLAPPPMPSRAASANQDPAPAQHASFSRAMQHAEARHDEQDVRVLVGSTNASFDPEDT